ncbi:Fc.00g045680.m01.CDS01 [Cosmosporella sp. VM-42]
MSIDSSTTPIPIILCGKTEQIGKRVIEGLKPEYEVVHFILTPEAGAKEIPEILQGRTPAGAGSTIGSGNFSSGVRAIVTGGAYNDDGIAFMQKAAARVAEVAWLRQDVMKPTPPLGPEYGKAMVSRVRETLNCLQLDGSLDDRKGETFWY